MRRLLREPLIHFLAIGAALFLFYAVAPLGDVSRTFGRDFAERIERFTPGTWTGPIPLEQPVKRLLGALL